MESLSNYNNVQVVAQVVSIGCLFTIVFLWGPVSVVVVVVVVLLVEGVDNLSLSHYPDLANISKEIFDSGTFVFKVCLLTML